MHSSTKRNAFLFEKKEIIMKRTISDYEKEIDKVNKQMKKLKEKDAKLKRDLDKMKAQKRKELIDRLVNICETQFGTLEKDEDIDFFEMAFEEYAEQLKNLKESLFKKVEEDSQEEKEEINEKESGSENINPIDSAENENDDFLSF